MKTTEDEFDTVLMLDTDIDAVRGYVPKFLIGSETIEGLIYQNVLKKDENFTTTTYTIVFICIPFVNSKKHAVLGSFTLFRENHHTIPYFLEDLFFCLHSLALPVVRYRLFLSSLFFNNQFFSVVSSKKSNVFNLGTISCEYEIVITPPPSVRELKLISRGIVIIVSDENQWT